MKTALTVTAASAALLAATVAGAVPYNRVYLVPALQQCVGAATCVPSQRASRYTFDTIVLRSPATKYMPVGKPSLYLEVRGVRDPSGAPVTGTLRLRVISGRVSVPGVGTFPDDSPLTVVPPVAVPIKNGSTRRFAYSPPTQAPNGTLVNGGGVEVYDPEGNLLAVTGSQSKP
jgi:hypothetical protein